MEAQPDGLISVLGPELARTAAASFHPPPDCLRPAFLIQRRTRYRQKCQFARSSPVLRGTRNRPWTRRAA
jgi:hypothetical protein